MSDPDEELKTRIRDQLDLKSSATGSDNDDGTASKMDGEDHDDQDDDENEDGADEIDTESGSDAASESGAAAANKDTAAVETEMGSMEEAVAAIAAQTDEDVSEEDVMDMLSPIVGEGDDGGDTDDEDDGMEQDADGELKAAAVEEIVDAKLDDRLDGLATEEAVDAKLERLVDALGDEIQQTMQKAATGSTPGPTASGGTDLTAGDLLARTGGDD
jgi:hypothetical protein